MARLPEQIPEPTLRLLLTGGLGARTLQRLREHFGADEHVVAASARELSAVAGVGRTKASAIRRAVGDADPDAERRVMCDHDARLVLLGDRDYPPLLRSIPDPPSALWLRGCLDDGDAVALAVVGSRRCTAYGRERAAVLSERLAAVGLTIVSGGALGIDGAAHRGALRCGGRTIAVMGCGLARCYPAAHECLFEDIVGAGAALLSEHPMRTPPLGHHFPRRNRILSGMSLGVLVIEAARRSGALITARQAAEDHGREVMVLPGRADSTASIGGLQAVRDGWAGLVLDQVDVLRQLECAGHLVRGAVELAERSGERSLPSATLNDEQTRLLSVIREADADFTAERLAETTRRPIGPVLGDLTVLEVLGLVARDVEGYVRRLTP